MLVDGLVGVGEVNIERLVLVSMGERTRSSCLGFFPLLWIVVGFVITSYSTTTIGRRLISESG